jgi:hypothetical protein
MALFGFALAGILLGLALNLYHGKKSNLKGIYEIRALWLPIAGLLLESIFTYFPRFALQFAGLIICTSYLCIFVFLFLNRVIKIPVVLIAAGSLSNFIVILCNGFRMPVSPASLAMYPNMTAAAVYAQRGNYFIAQSGANLYFLGDVIPSPLGAMGGFLSIGDLLLGFGILLFIVAILTKWQED